MAERTLQGESASKDHVVGTLLEAVAQPRAAAPAPDRAPILFEVSTEVCNQVGGIYQVIRSKAPLMTQRWGERYCLIGPWEPSKAGVEFEEVPAEGWLADAINELRSQGLHVHHGRAAGRARGGGGQHRGGEGLKRGVVVGAVGGGFAGHGPRGYPVCPPEAGLMDWRSLRIVAFDTETTGLNQEI